MIDGRNFFGQPIKIDLKTYDNIRRISTGQGDDYTTGYLLDYLYFKKHNNLIAIELSKQQTLDVDPKAIQSIDFTANLDRAEGSTMFFIIEEAKKKQFQIFQKEQLKYCVYFPFNIILI